MNDNINNQDNLNNICNSMNVITEKTIFIYNEYYEKYKTLISNNIDSKYIKYNTNKHHIIPCAVYAINKTCVNNDKSNIVNLSIIDHIMAHYYLALCVVDKYRTAMENAFFHLVNSHKEIPTEIELIKKLPEYEKIYIQYCKDLSTRFTHEEKSNAAKLGWKNRIKRGSFLNNKPISDNQRKIISDLFKGKKKSIEQRKKMSSSIKKFHKEHPDTLCGKNNPMYGRKRMHLISDPSIWLMVKPEQFEEYIKMGYTFNDRNFKFEVET